MNKDDQIILTIEKNILFNNNHFNGFLEKNKGDFENTILNNKSWTRRGDAEKDFTKKQPIVYAIILNNKTKKIFLYKRAGKGNYHEQRLWNKISCGIGGHIDKPDENLENPLTACLLRELEEELGISGEPEILGYINDDNAGEVEKVHFGVLYLIKTNEENLSPKDGEIATGKFHDLEEIETLSKDFELEHWSKIALNALKDLNFK